MSDRSRHSTKRFRRQENQGGDPQQDLTLPLLGIADGGGLACEEDSASKRGKHRLTSSVVHGDRNTGSSAVDDVASRRFAPQFHLKNIKTRPRSSCASVASSRHTHSTSSRRIKSARSVQTVSSIQKRPPRLALHIVCAVGENLARETCVASIDASSPISLQVSKQGNGQTYAETLAYLQMIKPHEVLLNEGRKNSPLARKIIQLFENQASHEAVAGAHDATEQTIVKFISRSCFDQTRGAEMLAKLARTDTFDPSLVDEYILLSSAHAVLQYTQQALGAYVARKCLDVTFNSGGNNRMSIDRSTLLHLELLVNAKTGKTTNSLVSSIDCTRTTVGARLLRTTLMAPPCRSDTVNARLDLVDAFLQHEEFFYSIMQHLKNLPAVDKMLTDIAVVPQNRCQRAQGESQIVTARMASKGISALVCVKTTLTALPALAGVLQDYLTDLEAGTDFDGSDVSAVTGRSCLLVGLGSGPPSTARPHQQYLLRAIIHALSQPQLGEIRNIVSDVFTQSTTFSRNANAMRHQECFALKSRDNGFMDVIRKAFLANVDDIYKKADEYAEIHGMHVSVRYSTARGYYLSVPASHAPTLPTVFIQPSKSGNNIFCTTEEVHSLNIRSQDNVQDLLLMTHERIQDVLADARSKYDALAALSDAIALLDLCLSFADNVTLSKLPWTRPILTGDEASGEETAGDGGILIRNGRYGIAVSDSHFTSSGGPQETIPNDTYASASKFFTVISGINGSGKSTYLKQIAIIVLLAHCGSYVPAEQASIPVSEIQL
jgi:DNA mismatch repair protein MSH4